MFLRWIHRNYLNRSTKEKQNNSYQNFKILVHLNNRRCRKPAPLTSQIDQHSNKPWSVWYIWITTLKVKQENLPIRTLPFFKMKKQWREKSTAVKKSEETKNQGRIKESKQGINVILVKVHLSIQSGVSDFFYINLVYYYSINLYKHFSFLQNTTNTSSNVTVIQVNIQLISPRFNQRVYH